MDKAYIDTVRLLLLAAPEVFSGEIFAMKGGTAINLMVRDMPRLSVDIDVVYRLWQTERSQALADISGELEAVTGRLKRLGLHCHPVSSKDIGDVKLVIEDETSQIKVEVNAVFRGTILPVELRKLSARTAEVFSAEMSLPVLAVDELYGSKLVAALDRQHPRDLFDVWQLREAGGLSEEAVECFVTYLAGHNRPIHEVLFGNDKNIADDFRDNFIGMTSEAVSLDTLLQAREWLRSELAARLTENQRQFLKTLSRAEPDWSLLRCPHAESLPALRWKLANLKIFQARRPKDFAKHVQILDEKLG
ncbi:hypothetical protein DB345_03285 [Spartobacteria bacterium LR76]|nr:hypothetical protein DB345_03285 [Spartobacteria bacterium LR76]